MIQLERVTPEEVGVHSSDVLQLLDVLEDNSISEIHALMLSRYGKVFTEGWWYPYAPGTPHAAWSMSKTYVSTAVGLAVHEGLFSLDDRMVDLLPEYSPAPEERNERHNAMTVRNMLKMSSGISDEVFGCDEDWVSVLMHSELTFNPGEKFSYVSNGTSALGVVIAKYTGMPMREYLKEKLFKPLGLNGENTFWIMLPDGTELGAGGLHCTTEVTLRLMLLYMQGGVWNGQRLLDEDFVKEATRFQVATTVENRVDHMPSAVDPVPTGMCGYGYQIWMEPRAKSWSARGAQGQLGVVFEDEQIACSLNQIMRNAHENEKVHAALIRLADSAADAPLPPDPENFEKLSRRLSRLCLPHPAFAQNEEACAALQGKTYHVTDGAVTFFPAFEPRERRGTGFHITGGLDVLQFSSTPDGRLLKITLVQDGDLLTLKAAMDGTRWPNTLRNPYTAPSEILMNAYWETNYDLVIRGRWIESTTEKALFLHFSEDYNEAEARCSNAVGTLGAFALAGEEARFTAGAAL